MLYTQLGQSQLNISRICLGCMGFGDPTQGQHSWTLDYPQSVTIIQQAFELGINFMTPRLPTKTAPVSNSSAEL